MSNEEQKPAGVAAGSRKRGKRPAREVTGELWAKCPECRMPVKDVELFKHLLKCPGAEARQAEWKAQEAAKANVKPEAETAAKPELKPEAEAAGQPDVNPETETQ